MFFRSLLLYLKTVAGFLLVGSAMWLHLAACGAPPGEGTDRPDNAGAMPAETESGTVDLLKDISESVGFDFTYFNGMSGEKYFVEMNGGGGALFDYDNDGDLDIYCVQGHFITEDGSLPDQPLYRDQLYRNDLSLLPDGTHQWSFTNVTESSLLDARGYGMGVSTGDYNNDGWIDLYVTNWKAVLVQL